MHTVNKTRHHNSDQIKKKTIIIVLATPFPLFNVAVNSWEATLEWAATLNYRESIHTYFMVTTICRYNIFLRFWLHFAITRLCDLYTVDKFL